MAETVTKTLQTVRDTLLKEDTREGYSDGVLDMYNEVLKLEIYQYKNFPSPGSKTRAGDFKSTLLHYNQ